jgi:hypothetical protein
MSATATAAAPERRLYDVHAAAQYLVSIGAVGTTVHFVRGLIGRGDIPHLKIGKAFFVSRESLDVWLQKNERRSR